MVGLADHGCGALHRPAVGHRGPEVNMREVKKSSRVGRTVRHPMWRNGLHTGIVVGILIGLCTVPVGRYIVRELDRIGYAQYQSDFGECKQLAAEIKAQQERYRMEVGKYEATHGPQPVGEPRMSIPIDDYHP